MKFITFITLSKFILTELVILMKVANLPDILHTKGLIAKAPACENTQDPLGCSSSGFISTTSILEIAEHSSINDTDEDSNEYIKDDPFPNNAPISIEKDSKKSEFLTAKVEDNHNICQSKDVNKNKSPKYGHQQKHRTQSLCQEIKK